MSPQDVEKYIENGIEGAKASVEDMTGTGDHFKAEVTASAFEGKSPIQQHKMVYAALHEYMSGSSAPIHALKLETRTP